MGRVAHASLKSEALPNGSDQSYGVWSQTVICPEVAPGVHLASGGPYMTKMDMATQATSTERNAT